MEKKELEVVKKSKEMINSNSNSNKDENKHTVVEHEAERFDITMRKIAEDWAMNSNLHGISNIFRNPGFFLKIFWILCFFHVSYMRTIVKSWHE